MVVAVVVGAALAGFVQGLTGSNFGLVAMAAWAWTLNPTLTGPLIVFGSLVGQLLAAGSLRHTFSKELLLPMVAGGLLGVPIGVLILKQINPDIFRLMVGFLLAVWCPLMLFSKTLPNIEWGGRTANACVGALGGIMGGIGGLTGPAPALWATLKGWNRYTQRSVIQGFNLAMQTLTMITYFASGTVTSDALTLFPIVAASVLLPTLLGIKIFHRFDDETFRKAVLGLLAVSGVILVTLSVPHLLV